jgi:hypothetical protein
VTSNARLAVLQLLANIFGRFHVFHQSNNRGVKQRFRFTLPYCEIWTCHASTNGLKEVTQPISPIVSDVAFTSSRQSNTLGEKKEEGRRKKKNFQKV